MSNYRHVGNREFRTSGDEATPRELNILDVCRALDFLPYSQIGGLGHTKEGLIMLSGYAEGVFPMPDGAWGSAIGSRNPRFRCPGGGFRGRPAVSVPPGWVASVSHQRQMALSDHQVGEARQKRDPLPVLRKPPVAHPGVAEAPLEAQEPTPWPARTPPPRCRAPARAACPASAPPASPPRRRCSPGACQPPGSPRPPTPAAPRRATADAPPSRRPRSPPSYTGRGRRPTGRPPRCAPSSRNTTGSPSSSGASPGPACPPCSSSTTAPR